MLRLEHGMAPVLPEPQVVLPPATLIAGLGLPVETIATRSGSVSRYRWCMDEVRPQAAALPRRERAVTVWCVQSGQIELKLNARSLEARGGQAVLVNEPGRVRTCLRSASAEVVAVAVPHAELTSETFRYLGTAQLSRVGSPFAECLKMLSQWVDLARQDEAASLYECVKALLLAEAKRAQVRGCGKTGNAELLARIQAHVQKNLKDRNLRASLVAPWFGISARYVHKLFEAQGETFGSFVLARRIEAVSAELSRGEIPRRSIAQIAGEWGFVDVSSFNRAFRARYGCTPTQFRDLGG